ncbi:MAG: hypothetical protein SF162_02655 [bacterium]|nr:hypothetical protein [bacterium]
MTVRQTAETAWEWSGSGSDGYGVRAFPKTETLIWSSWTNTAEGPHFADGVKQTYQAFSNGEPPPFAVPPDVADALRRLTSPEPPQKRGRLRFGRS